MRVIGITPPAVLVMKTSSASRSSLAPTVRSSTLMAAARASSITVRRDMGHVVGRVRAEEAPVQDRHARLADRHEATVDESGSAGEILAAVGRALCHIGRISIALL